MEDNYIVLMPASEYRREHYGVMLESVMEHSVTGRDVHNRHHPHKVEMWENRPNKDGVIVTPSGKPTDELHTFLLNAQAVAITSTPSRLPASFYRGADLVVGEIVTLVALADEDPAPQILGRYRIESRPLADPILIPLNNESEEG